VYICYCHGSAYYTAVLVVYIKNMRERHGRSWQSDWYFNRLCYQGSLE